MIELREKIRVELWDYVLPNMFWAQESFKMWDYLTSKLEVDENLIINRNSYFLFARQSHFNSVILSLTKLYHHKETHNFKTFINKFRSGKEYGELEITLEKINAWSDTINSQNETIEAVLKWRHKYIAHDLPEIEKPTISKGDLRELINTAQNIFIGIYQEVFNSYFTLKDPFNEPLEDLKEIVSALVNQRKESLMELIEIEKLLDK